MSRARDFADLAGSADAGGLTGRNLIINGAMQVAQRGTSQTGITGNGYFQAPDRFRFEVNSAGTWSVSQSTTAPDGFSNSYKIDCTTADASLAAGDYVLFMQRLEGQDLQHLKKGTASAESVTISFWVRSAKTGTYIVELDDNDNARNINKSFTISAADTWEHKTITFAGDTTGAFDNDNNASLRVIFWLAAGSNFTTGTLATSWEATNNVDRAVGNVNLADSTSNNWYITGVQLEVGEQATPFEHRSYADELVRCSRYLKQYKSTTLYNQFAFAHTESTTSHSALFTFDPPMRDTPTSVTVGGNIGIITQWGLGVTGISAVSLQGTSKGFTQTRLVCTTSTGVGTAGECNILLSNNNASSTINFDAEL